MYGFGGAGRRGPLPGGALRALGGAIAGRHYMPKGLTLAPWLERGAYTPGHALGVANLFEPRQPGGLVELRHQAVAYLPARGKAFG
jgi:hypothetical protein